ncbi:MAG: tRNA (adenosine(37)-N6)-threonylcarbamoyltransferase complex dimerization subunit type 1 TsaB [bacterium]
MPLLSIDSSNGYSNVLITDENSNKIFESISDFHEKHSILIFKQLDEMVRKAGIKLSDLTGIAVILGPGSYTGIRVSLTIAKTAAYCLGINITGIGSLFACAYSITKNSQNLKNVIAIKYGIKNNYYVLAPGNSKITLLNLDEIKSLAKNIKSDTMLVYGYNKKSEYERFEAEFKNIVRVEPFDLKKTAYLASMYALENKAADGFKYAEELSPYYVYGDGPF